MEENSDVTNMRSALFSSVIPDWSDRAVREGPLSTRATQSSRSSGEVAYHYSYLQFDGAVRKGSFQLVRLVQVVQVVKLNIIRLTYSTVELCGRGSFQVVRLVQVVQLVKLYLISDT